MTGHLGPAGPAGFAVLDIGRGVGALVVVTPPELAGAEVEVARDGDGVRTHAEVRRRPGAGTRWAAVYPSLHPGRYRVLRDDGSVAAVADVAPGRVARVRL